MAKKKLAQAVDYAAQTFDAALSSEQIDDLEQSAERPAHECARRVGLSVLGRSKEQFMERMNKEAAIALLSAYDDLHAYVQHLDAVRSLMNTARLRLMVVLESAIQANPELASLEVEEAEA